MTEELDHMPFLDYLHEVRWLLDAHMYQNPDRDQVYAAYQSGMSIEACVAQFLDTDADGQLRIQRFAE